MKITPRNIFAWVVSNLLIAFGFVERAKKKALNGEFILSFYFHNPTKKEFESCLKWLKGNGFVFLSPKDLDEIAKGKVAFPKAGVFLSVDDGWQSNKRNIVEVALKHDVPVTIFVSTEPVEKGAYWWSFIQHDKVQYLKTLPNEERLFEVATRASKMSLKRESLSIEELKQIAKASQIFIEGHTHTHPILTNCSAEAVHYELLTSKRKLEKWTKKEVTMFAYPNGDYGCREIEILKSLNYQYAFTNKPIYLKKDSLKNPYEIPRFGFLEGASFAENICRMVGVWQRLIQKKVRVTDGFRNTLGRNS